MMTVRDRRGTLRRRLTDGIRTWTVDVDGVDVTRTSTRGDRTDSSVRTWETPAEAIDFAQQECTARLRKGMVLTEPDAEIGQPLYQRHIGQGYTGAMPVAGDGSRLYSSARPRSGPEKIVAADPVHPAPTSVDDGLIAELDVDVLIWELFHDPASGALVAHTDVEVRVWDATAPAPVGAEADSGGAGAGEGADAGPEVDPGPGPGRLLAGSAIGVAAAGGLVAVGAREGGTVSVMRIADGRLGACLPAEPELYRGHTPLLRVALSGDGRMLAFAHEESRVELRRLDPATGDQEPGDAGRTVPVPAGEIVDLRLSADGALLVVVTREYDSVLTVVDTETGLPAQAWPELGGERITCALSGDYLAVFLDGRISIFDLSTGRRRLELRPEQFVRWLAMSFSGDALAVRTDLGVLSLYRIC